MRVFVNMKQIGKRKNVIDKKEYEIADNISLVSDLIREFVSICVKDFNQEKIIDYLLEQDIKDNADVGKIGFNDRENKNKQDVTKAIDNAIQSYEDGIYRIFVNDEEVGALNDSINLKQDDTITFIRLTMLAGAMF